MTKRCADLSDWARAESRYSINKSLTCILRSKSFGSERFYHTCTHSDHKHLKQRKVKEVFLLQLRGCVVCTKSYVPISLHSSPLPLNISFDSFPECLAFLYKTYFGIFVYLLNNYNKKTKIPSSPRQNLEQQIQCTASGGLEIRRRKVHRSLFLFSCLVGIEEEDGMAAWMKVATSKRGGPSRAGKLKILFVGFWETDALMWVQNLRWDLCFTMYLMNEKQLGSKVSWFQIKKKTFYIANNRPYKTSKYLSRVSQKRRKTGRSRWRLWRLSSRTVTSHFCTFGSVFASSYFKWKARTEKENVHP